MWVTPQQDRRLRIHSYSDRIRYYWTDSAVQHAVQSLLANLETSGIPETMLGGFLPSQDSKVRDGMLRNAPLPLILDKIGDALNPYIAACGAAYAI